MLLPHSYTLFKGDFHLGKRAAKSHDLTQVLVGKMGVEVDGDRAVAVAQNLRDRFNVGSPFDGE